MDRCYEEFFIVERQTCFLMQGIGGTISIEKFERDPIDPGKTLAVEIVEVMDKQDNSQTGSVGHTASPYSLYESFELNTIQYATSKSASDQTLKLAHIFSKQFCCFVVERIIRVGLVEQIDESVDYRVDVEYRLPVFP